MPYMYGPNLAKHTDITEVMKKKKYPIKLFRNRLSTELLNKHIRELISLKDIRARL